MKCTTVLSPVDSVKKRGPPVESTKKATTPVNCRVVVYSDSDEDIIVKRKKIKTPVNRRVVVISDSDEEIIVKRDKIKTPVNRRVVVSDSDDELNVKMFDLGVFGRDVTGVVDILNDLKDKTGVVEARSIMNEEEDGEAASLEGEEQEVSIEVAGKCSKREEEAVFDDDTVHLILGETESGSYAVDSQSQQHVIDTEVVDVIEAKVLVKESQLEEESDRTVPESIFPRFHQRLEREGDSSEDKSSNEGEVESDDSLIRFEPAFKKNSANPQATPIVKKKRSTLKGTSSFFVEPVENTQPTPIVVKKRNTILGITSELVEPIVKKAADTTPPRRDVFEVKTGGLIKPVTSRATPVVKMKRSTLKGVSSHYIEPVFTGPSTPIVTKKRDMLSDANRKSLLEDVTISILNVSISSKKFEYPSSEDDENAGVLVYDGTPSKPIKRNNPVDIWTPAKNFDTTPVKKPTVSAPSTPYKKVDKQFVKNRERLAREFYGVFNSRVFSKQLPADLQIDWSNTLNKTAGRCYTKRTINDGQVGYQARIELSSKVVDDVEKLKSTVFLLS
jgi:hypothetical protein